MKTIDYDSCVKCGCCAGGIEGDKRCPTSALTFDPKLGPTIDEGLCVDCGLCSDLCALGVLG